MNTVITPEVKQEVITTLKASSVTKQKKYIQSRLTSAELEQRKNAWLSSGFSAPQLDMCFSIGLLSIAPRN